MSAPTRLTWFIAKRYLSATRGGFLSFITWIALGGIIVGVSALTVVIGVMTGMQEDLREKILSTTAHVLVQQAGPSLRMDDWQQVLTEVEEVGGVEAARPIIFATVLLETGGFSRPAQLIGVPVDGNVQGAITELDRQIQSGAIDLGVGESGLPKIAMGVGLAELMLAFPGDTMKTLTIETSRLDRSTMGLLPDIALFEYSGAFETGMYEYDTEFMYTSLEAAQDFLKIREDDRVSAIAVRVDDVEVADAVADSIESRLGYGYATRNWMTDNRSLFSALKLEKIAMWLILSLIILVAAFNVVSTLVMVVADRTREIGILKSMGMTDGAIRRVFVFQGAWIGVVGTTLGVLAGLGVCWVMVTFRVPRIPPEVYFVDRLPVTLHPADLLMIVGASVAIAFLATIYPSMQAARLDPVEAIRHE